MPDLSGHTAVLETFARRGTTLTRQVPFGLTVGFAQDAQKQIQWKAFLRKNRLDELPLNEVVQTLATFMQPIFESASDNIMFAAIWNAGGPWSLTNEI